MGDGMEDGGRVGRLEQTIPSDIICLSGVLDAIGNLLEERGVPSEVISDVELATDEAITNVITHGYKGETGGVRVIADAGGDGILIRIEDESPPFDPTQYIPRDVTKDGDDRPIGGLGIILIRNVMDDVGYMRVGNKNILTMRKKRMTGP
jgi:serine/threonine-protein kinase RsbW